MDLKRRRSSDKQIDHLVNFMMNHQKFSSGKFQGYRGKTFLAETWERLSKELNEIGRQKDVEQWKKVWKNQKLLTRKRNSEIKVAQNRTGNISPPPPLTERESKIICIIGKESSEGLGFSEGSISEEMLAVSNTYKLETRQTTTEIPNFEENVIENIYIVSEENEFDINITSEDAQTSGNRANDGARESELVTGKKKIEQNRETKAMQENQLFKNLIDTNSNGLYAIAHSLELVAASNNNIAAAIKSFNNANKD